MIINSLVFSGYRTKFIVEKDIQAMFFMCPFQINSWGESPFCDIFTEKEWKYFNYAMDLATYYASGYTPPV